MTVNAFSCVNFNFRQKARVGKRVFPQKAIGGKRVFMRKIKYPGEDELRKTRFPEEGECQKTFFRLNIAFPAAREWRKMCFLAEKRRETLFPGENLISDRRRIEEKAFSGRK